MAGNRLSIVAMSGSATNEYTRVPSRSARRRELQAKYERLWLLDPEQFNPLRNCMERERLDRTQALIVKMMDLSGKKVVDLGCGAGVFSFRLSDAGATTVDAVDIAENALKRLRENKKNGVMAIQDAMPDTTLADGAYDLVVCTELIADLPSDDYRLFFSELSRLVKPDGLVLFSTAVDIDSEGAVERLMDLLQTEFDIVKIVASYHALHIRLKRLCEKPAGYLKGWKEKEERKRELVKRNGISRWWYWLNTLPPMAWLWWSVSLLMKPILHFLRENRTFLLACEKVARFFGDENQISHLIFMAKRRPLVIESEEPPVRRLGKKEIWE